MLKRFLERYLFDFSVAGTSLARSNNYPVDPIGPDAVGCVERFPTQISLSLRYCLARAVDRFVLSDDSDRSVREVEIRPTIVSTVVVVPWLSSLLQVDRFQQREYQLVFGERFGFVTDIHSGQFAVAEENLPESAL